MEVIKFNDCESWAARSASAVQGAIDDALKVERPCNVMLTGGRSARLMYSKWVQDPRFSKISNVNFYFGDERYVPIDDERSNVGMTMRTLFKYGVPKDCTVNSMEADGRPIQEIVDDYERGLPKRIHVAIFGLGEDGHIASIFPNSEEITHNMRRVVSVLGPEAPKRRITITGCVFKEIQKIFILAPGVIRAALADKAKRNPQDILSLPALLAPRATWLVSN